MEQWFTTYPHMFGVIGLQTPLNLKTPGYHLCDLGEQRRKVENVTEQMGGMEIELEKNVPLDFEYTFRKVFDVCELYVFHFFRLFIFARQPDSIFFFFFFNCYFRIDRGVELLSTPRSDSVGFIWASYKVALPENN